MDDLEAAIERLSDEMMNRIEVVETPIPGGLVEMESFVRVRYDDLRVALSALDRA